MPIDGNPFTSRNAWGMVMAFGFIMFSTLTAGVICIRLYQDDVAKYNLAMAKVNGQPVVAYEPDKKPSDAEKEKSEVDSQDSNGVPLPRRGLKIAHAVCMTISWIMLLGAGIAFTAVRINKYKNCGVPGSMC